MNFLIFRSYDQLQGFKAMKIVYDFQRNNWKSFWNKNKCDTLRDQKVFWLISFLLWTKIYTILLWQINLNKSKTNENKKCSA